MYSATADPRVPWRDATDGASLHAHQTEIKPCNPPRGFKEHLKLIGVPHQICPGGKDALRCLSRCRSNTFTRFRVLPPLFNSLPNSCSHTAGSKRILKPLMSPWHAAEQVSVGEDGQTWSLLLATIKAAGRCAVGLRDGCSSDEMVGGFASSGWIKYACRWANSYQRGLPHQAGAGSCDLVNQPSNPSTSPTGGNTAALPLCFAAVPFSGLKKRLLLLQDAGTGHTPHMQVFRRAGKLLVHAMTLASACKVMVVERRLGLF